MLPTHKNNNNNNSNKSDDDNDMTLQLLQNNDTDTHSSTIRSAFEESSDSKPATTPPPPTSSLTSESESESGGPHRTADAKHATGSNGDAHPNDSREHQCGSLDERAKRGGACSSEIKINSELAHQIIPGVEHVFFEDEFEKMEHSSEETNVIILAVDDGVHSEMAFKFYKENVDRPGYILHVLHHSDMWSHIKHGDEGPSANHCKEIVEKAKGVLDVVEEKYKKLMEENNITGEVISVHGKDAWHDIIQYQEKSNAMMIVMGTRGAGALSRTFRGSVSDSVVHHAHVPVLVCCHPKD